MSFMFGRASHAQLENLAKVFESIATMLASHGPHIQGNLRVSAEAGWPSSASGADSDGGGGGGGGRGSAVESAVERPDRAAERARGQLDKLNRLLAEAVLVERILAAHLPTAEQRGTAEVCSRCGAPMGGRSRCQERPNGIQCGGFALGSDPSVERSVRMCSECGKRPARQGRRQCETCKARRRRGHHTLADYRDTSGIIEETTA